MTHQKIHASNVVKTQLKQDIPDFKVGSVVAVKYKIFDGGKERLQTFKGIVTNRRGGTSVDATFTVMKSSFGQVKVERTFPLHSPIITEIKVEVLQRARRANLNKLAFALKDIVKSLRSKPVTARPVNIPQPTPVKAVEPEAASTPETVADEVPTETTETKE
jgi:large subunit ribosomal protein L19